MITSVRYRGLSLSIDRALLSLFKTRKLVHSTYSKRGELRQCVYHESLFCFSIM
uniref:Uncharacterized protein n=1 Tax=Anguilla anguilla TaxID=7936 RepID=A0A0E9RQA1_ANGAN